MSRPRAAAVVIRTGADQTEVLMVQHHLDGRTWWTLPGGGVESGETYAAAAVRELREETGLKGVVRRCLCSRNDRGNPEQGWLVDVSAGDPALGADPELGNDDQELCGIGWMVLTDLADDVQIALVIAALESAGPSCLTEPGVNDRRGGSRSRG